MDLSDKLPTASRKEQIIRYLQDNPSEETVDAIFKILEVSSSGSNNDIPPSKPSTSSSSSTSKKKGANIYILDQREAEDGQAQVDGEVPEWDEEPETYAAFRDYTFLKIPTADELEQIVRNMFPAAGDVDSRIVFYAEQYMEDEDRSVWIPVDPRKDHLAVKGWFLDDGLFGLLATVRKKQQQQEQAEMGMDAEVGGEGHDNTGKRKLDEDEISPEKRRRVAEEEGEEHGEEEEEQVVVEDEPDEQPTAPKPVRRKDAATVERESRERKGIKWERVGEEWRTVFEKLCDEKHKGETYGSMKADSILKIVKGLGSQETFTILRGLLGEMRVILLRNNRQRSPTPPSPSPTSSPTSAKKARQDDDDDDAAADQTFRAALERLHDRFLRVERDVSSIHLVAVLSHLDSIKLLGDRDELMVMIKARIKERSKADGAGQSSKPPSPPPITLFPGQSPVKLANAVIEYVLAKVTEEGVGSDKLELDEVITTVHLRKTTPAGEKRSLATKTLGLAVRLRRLEEEFGEGIFLLLFYGSTAGLVHKSWFETKLPVYCLPSLFEAVKELRPLVLDMSERLSPFVRAIRSRKRTGPPEVKLEKSAITKNELRGLDDEELLALLEPFREDSAEL